MVDPVRGPVLQPFGGHPGRVLAVAVTPDGEEIITAGGDGTRVWNRRSGEQRATLTGHADWVWAVAVTPDGEEIITVGDGATAAWWEQLGRAAYPGAKTLTITADSDGSNSARQ